MILTINIYQIFKDVISYFKVVGELNVELYALRKTPESVRTLPSSEAAVQTSFIGKLRLITQNFYVLICSTKGCLVH